MKNEVIVMVGSENPVKMRAVENAFKDYGFNPKVIGVKASSGVHKQPKTINQIVTGAKNRAKNSYSKECNFSVGLEGGIYRFPEGNSDYVNMTCAAIFDGKRFYFGHSPGFVCPKSVAKRLVEEDTEFGEIFDELLGEKNTKQKQGAVGTLTKGIVNREKFVELSIIMALCQIASKNFYE